MYEFFNEEWVDIVKTILKTKSMTLFSNTGCVRGKKIVLY